MRVGIIGTGPAGAVCALTLLHRAPELGQQHDVWLFDGKSFGCIGPQGCNMCAGVIPTTLFDLPGMPDRSVLSPVIQRYITGHYFETNAGSIHVPKEPGVTLCTVFRSAGPRGDVPDLTQSFDTLLLKTALANGANLVSAHIGDMEMPGRPDAPYRLSTRDGQVFEVDVVVGAFGVNSGLSARFEQLGFGYRRPQTYHVCQAELPLEPDFIESTFGGEIKIFTLGMQGIRFGALTPKRRHVTVTVIGTHVKRMDLERFLADPRIRRHFPDGWTLPLQYCHCHPQLPVTAARNVVSDRLMVIGDAHISRYLKGGIESAFFTGTLAAEMILEGRLSRSALMQGYVRPARAHFLQDNAWGRLLFRCNDVISRQPVLARVGLWLLYQEQCMPDWHDRPHTQLLWQIFSGQAPYRHIIRQAVGLRAMRVVLRIIWRAICRRRCTTAPEA